MDSDAMLIELIKDNEYRSNDKLNMDDDVGEVKFEGNHFDKFPTRSELAYHKSYYNWIMTTRLAPRKNPKSPGGQQLYRVSHVILGKPFVELSGITYDSSLGVEIFDENCPLETPKSAGRFLDDDLARIIIPSPN
uniref:Uncharacterized protein n=1 Tax=Tanacetum cinerariifolium TaxID=118510 RepID=A0A6L2JHY0_TANCI|nr:hypothetical protein [Tanacetum cinerariifolium]